MFIFLDLQIYFIILIICLQKAFNILENILASSMIDLFVGSLGVSERSDLECAQILELKSMDSKVGWPLQYFLYYFILINLGQNEFS